MFIHGNHNSHETLDWCQINAVKLRCLGPFVIGPTAVGLRKRVFKWQFHKHLIQKILSRPWQEIVIGCNFWECYEWQQVASSVIMLWSNVSPGYEVPMLMIRDLDPDPHSCGPRGVLIMPVHAPLVPHMWYSFLITVNYENKMTLSIKKIINHR